MLIHGRRLSPWPVVARHIKEEEEEEEEEEEKEGEGEEEEEEEEEEGRLGETSGGLNGGEEQRLRVFASGAWAALLRVRVLGPWKGEA